MSVKIYEGLKLDTVDVSEIQNFLIKFKELALKEFNDQLFKRIGRTIVGRHDFYVLGVTNEEPKIDINDIYDILHDIADKCRETQIKFERDTENDYFCALKLYILSDKTLLFCEAENPFYQKILESLDEVSEYGYWNNTDKPDDIDDDAWEQRHDEWITAFECVPAWTYEVFGIRDFPYELHEIRNIEKYYPSLEARVKRVAESIALTEKFKDFDDTVSVSHVTKYIFSDEYKHDMERISNEIRDRFTDIGLYQKLTSK